MNTLPDGIEGLWFGLEQTFLALADILHLLSRPAHLPSHHRETEKANAKLSEVSRDGVRKMPGCPPMNNLGPLTAAETGL